MNRRTVKRTRARVVLFSEINSKFGYPFLRLLDNHACVSLVGLVTTRPGGRCSYFLGESHEVNLEQEARKRQVPVLRPVDVNDADSVAALRGRAADYFVVMNYQQILGKELITLPGTTAINFHTSPLPEYAGLAPHFWMAKTGARTSGVTAHLVTPRIDAGPVVAQRMLTLSGSETALGIREIHERACVRLLNELIPQLCLGRIESAEQDLSVRSYFGRPQERDYWLDLEGSVTDVLRTVRAGYRRPGAYAVTRAGSIVTVLSAVASPDMQHVPAPPGITVRMAGAVHVRAGDGWVRILTIEEDGEEAPPGAVPDFLTEFRSRKEGIGVTA
ncbi:methionyl-tRNA formyltransferase [Streptomyces sp. NPDC008343]|uniref:methionyl-tRNA formyltransferase n=1 Tax=Streptomyces sp. NPDC008343 TaxID=3364828 RepID=UPI0036EAC694